MTDSPMGITRFILQAMLEQQFDSSLRTMSSQIKCSLQDLKYALVTEEARATPRVFECLMRYCQQNGIAVDAIFRSYHAD